MVITAKFGGTCRLCRTAITPGEKIHWAPASAAHMKGGCPQVARTSSAIKINGRSLGSQLMKLGWRDASQDGYPNTAWKLDLTPREGFIREQLVVGHNARGINLGRTWQAADRRGTSPDAAREFTSIEDCLAYLAQEG